MLRVEPWAFTTAVPAENTGPDSFALDHSGRRYRLALNRATSQSRPQPTCVFLFRVPGGAARCGLGEDRPMPCKTFPCELIEGEVRVASAACSCGPWALDDVDVEAERALLDAEGAMRTRYQGVVARWNEYVERLDVKEPLTHRDFCVFLLSAYRE